MSTATGGYDFKLGELIGDIKSANRILEDLKLSARDRQAAHEKRMKDAEDRIAKLELSWFKLIILTLVMSGIGAFLPKGWDFILKLF